MNDTNTQVTQARAARIAGAMFLFINATGIFGEIFVRGSLLSGDTTQMAQNIIGSERLFRISVFTDLATFTGGLVLIWALYVLLRPVDRSVALLGLCLRLVETAVSVGATVNSLIALRLLSGAEFLKVFEESELHTLSRLAINAFGYGYDIGFIFTGLGSTVFAYLLLRSRYVPRILGGWGVFASLLFTAYNLWIIVFPGAGKTLMWVSFAPMGIYEIPLGLWFLLKGAKVPASLASAA